MRTEMVWKRFWKRFGGSVVGEMWQLQQKEFWILHLKWIWKLRWCFKDCNPLIMDSSSSSSLKRSFRMFLFFLSSVIRVLPSSVSSLSHCVILVSLWLSVSLQSLGSDWVCYLGIWKKKGLDIFSWVMNVDISIEGYRKCDQNGNLETFLSCNLGKRQRSLCAQQRTHSFPLAAKVMILKLPLAVSFVLYCTRQVDLRKPLRGKNTKKETDHYSMTLCWNRSLSKKTKHV